MFHYSVKDGLPSNEVHCIYEDSKGYIWICTDAGLAKYNANVFRIFDASSGLPDNTVFEVFEDDWSRLWFRTYTGGIGYIRNDSVYTIGANKKILGIQKDGFCESFAIDKKGNLFLGNRSFEDCFFILVAPPYKEENIHVERSPSIRTLGAEARLIGNRIIFSESHSASVSVVRNESVYLKLSISDESSKLIYTDSIRNNAIGIVTRFYRDGNDLYYTDKARFNRYNLQTHKISELFRDRDILSVLRSGDSLLLGQRSNGVAVASENGKSNFSGGFLKGKSISWIMKDSRNGYWYATLEDGIYYCPDKGHFGLTLYDSKTGEQIMISCFKKTGDSTLVVGTQTGRLYIVNFNASYHYTTRLVYTNEGKFAIDEIIPFDHSRVIVENGITYADIVDLERRKVIRSNEVIPKVKNSVPMGGSVVCSVIKHFLIFDTLNGKRKAVDYDQKITGMAIDPEQKDILYVAGFKGVCALSFNDSSFNRRQIVNVRSQDVKCIHGTLYIATKSHGLIIYRNRSCDTISIKNNLLSNTCRKLFTEGENVLVVTNKGVTRLTYHNKNDVSIRNFPFERRIFPEAVNYISWINNSLVFRDGNELVFLPRKQAVVKESFRFGSVAVNGIEYPPGRLPRLAYHQAAVSVNMEALFYRSNRSISYRYRFRKKDTAWTYTDHAGLLFPSLSPGDYELEVQALNPENVWVGNGQSLSFVIDKPFWQRWWFIGFCAILCAGFIATFITRRSQRILEKERSANEISNRLSEMQIRVLKAQMSPHFIFNALNSVQQFIIINENDKAEKYLSKFSRLLRQLLESNVRENIRLSDEIDVLKKYLEIEQLRFNKVFDFKIEVDGNVDPDGIDIPHYLVQPFVENAIWHGLLPKEGNKELVIRFEMVSDKSLSCTIEDNGVGRQTKSSFVNTEKRSLAINFIRQRLEMMSKISGHNYTLTLTDKIDPEGKSEGTKVVVLIPVFKADDIQGNHN